MFKELFFVLTLDMHIFKLDLNVYFAEKCCCGISVVESKFTINSYKCCRFVNHTYHKVNYLMFSFYPIC